MDKQKNDENIVLKLKRHLSKMMVQVDFLYRNGREMSQFDYDMLMDRTREFYELLIDAQVDNHDNDYDYDYDNDYDNDDKRVEINEGGEMIDHDVEFEIETPGSEEETAEEPEEKPDEEPAEEPEDEDDDDWEDEDDEIFSIAPAEEENPVNPISNQNSVDDSLAARLQRQPISNIKSAVSLNDRIMLIHDLFKGSEERYNKIINELNEFPTLGGAMVYLSELGVQLQWDTESVAFLKLQELVERRFL